MDGYQGDEVILKLQMAFMCAGVPFIGESPQLSTIFEGARSPHVVKDHYQSVYRCRVSWTLPKELVPKASLGENSACL